MAATLSGPDNTKISPGAQGMLDELNQMFHEHGAARAEQELRRRLEEITLLGNIINLTTLDEDVNVILQKICEQLAQFLNVQQSAFALFNPQRTEATIIADYHPADSPGAEGERIPVADNPSMAHLLQHKKPLVIGDAQTNPLLAPVHDLMQRRGIKTMLLVPVLVENEVVGTLEFDSFTPRDFSPFDIALVQHISKQTGVVLKRKWAEDALDYRQQFENTIMTISTEFIHLGPHEIDRGVDQALATIGRFAGVDRSYIFRFSQDGTTVSNTHEWCADAIEPQIEHLQNIPVEDLSWWMERLGRLEPVYVRRVADMPPGASAEKEILEAQDIKSLICVPLISQENLIGFLGFDAVRAEKVWPTDIIDLLSIAGQIFVNALERKRAEEELKVQRNFALSVMKTMGQGLTVTDVNTRYQFVNPAFSRMLGYRPTELIGKKTADFIHPDDCALLDEAYTQLQTGKRHNYEVRLRHAHGHLVYALVTSVPRWRNDRINGSISVVTDLTQSKAAETEIRRQKQYFEALVQNSPVAIVTMDLNKQITACNPTFEQLFGYSEEEVIGQDLDELITNDKLKDEAQTYTQNVMDGELVHEIGKRRRKDGAWVDIEIFGVPVIVEDERIGALGLYHDITEIVRARQEAEAAAQAKSEFLANMSHEIRTPLNAIIGLTGLLLDTPLNREQEDFLNTVRNSGDTLLTIINDILDFSKIEAGKLELEEQPFDLRQSVEESLDLLAARAAEKNLELAYMMSFQVPSMVIGDVTRLRQILVNLLSNAIKFTDEGEVVLSVTGQPQKDGRYQLQFAVRDTGIGIPEDRLERLFKSFSQVDTSTTREYGGTGLGLAISKQLAEMMGGGMWVESKVDVGSIFYFTILVDPVPNDEETPPTQLQPTLTGKRVLIVDDNKTNCLILQRQTASWGMNVNTVTSGTDALIHLHHHTFDLIILDMQMPEMDGLTLVQKIHQLLDQQAPPFIMLTSMGYSKQTTDDGLLAAQLLKPVKPSQLYDAITETLMSQHPMKVSEQPPQPVEATAHPISPHPLRILLVEDNTVNQKVALRMLERLGYRADVAANGVEALDALARQAYDVVLMDVQMPKMDGVEATRQIRAGWPPSQQPYIIAMTANALKGDRERYIEAGMDGYVSKPMRPEDLRRALEQHQPAGTIEANASHNGVNHTPPAPIDTDRLAAQMGEPAEQVLQDLAPIFLEDAGHQWQQLRQALETNNVDAVQTVAHTLKSSSANIGAVQLAALCEKMETYAAGQDMAGARRLWPQLQEAYDQTIATLARYQTTNTR